MKVKFKVLCCLFLIVNTFVFASGSKEEVINNSINVYTTKSFAGSWGAGPSLAAKFKEETNIDVNYIITGSATSLIPKLHLDGKDSNCDVVIGITDKDLVQALDLDYFTSLSSIDTSKIKKDALLDKSLTVLPYDMGYYCFNYNTDKLKVIPKNLNDLLKKDYEKQIIISDPRTSSTGYALLIWTIITMGEEKAFAWWENIKPNLLSITQDWSSSYALFTSGEAPIMFGFSTSVIWEALSGEKVINLPLVFDEHLLPTIEFLGISKYSKNKENSVKFINFLLNEGQKEITNSNKMFSVLKDFNYPDEFNLALSSEKLDYDLNLIEKNKKHYLERWTNIMNN